MMPVYIGHLCQSRRHSLLVVERRDPAEPSKSINLPENPTPTSFLLMRLWDIISHIPPAFNFCARPRIPVLHEGVECKVERCNELSPHESCGGKGEGWWGWECSLISCCEAPMIFEEVRMLLYWVVLNLRWVLVVRGFGAWRPDAGRRRWKGGAGLGLAHKLVLYRKVGWQY